MVNYGRELRIGGDIRKKGKVEKAMEFVDVVATTRRNSTYSLLTSAKLSIGYLVVEITREPDKEPLLYCSSIYTTTSWFVLQ